MIWIIAALPVALIVIAVRYATTPARPDRRPGELQDVSRSEMLRRMRENRDRHRAVRRAYELEPVVAEFATAGDEWSPYPQIVRPMGVKP